MIVIGTFFLLILYLFTCSAVYKSVSRKTQSKKIKTVTIILLLLLGFGDNIAGNAVFYYLVWKKGGERIYRTVDNVPGFMLVTDYGGTVTTFMNDLYSGKYKFIEEQVTKGNFDESKFAEPWPYAREKGFYRFYFSNAGDDKCKDYFDHYAKYRRKPPFPADKCMAYERIESPKSKYSVEFDKETEILMTIIVLPVINVSIRSTIIKDPHTGNILAEANKIYYAGGWVSRCIFDYRQSRTYPYEPETIDGHKLIFNTLKPLQK